ncbi:ECM11 domain-containing protein [Mycena kentingensis (nom. inval.)]|nr:ECM11 domain-containing protein [Mycena kentingensis (nom. inval.)]
MSARSPFLFSNNVPSQPMPSPAFAPDMSNPLHTATKPADGAPMLNLSGLSKSNRSQAQTQNNPLARRPSMSRPTTSDPHGHVAHQAGLGLQTTRPGTSDPHKGNHRLQQHAHNGILAPMPRKTPQPPLFASGGFKAPALPGSADDASSMALPGQNGPHRVVFGSSMAQGQVQTRPVAAEEEDDDCYEMPPPMSIAKQAGKRTRGELEDEGDEEDEPGNAAHPQKRFKPAPAQVDDRERAYSRNSHGHGHDFNHQRHSSSPHERSYNAQAQAYHHPTAMQQPHAPPPALARLLGLLKADTVLLDEPVIESKIAEYERSAERWRSCTREEWLAGAEEITAKYNKVFDFVKTHMTAKIALFTSCDTRLAEHDKVLAEREELLSHARVHLLENGGEVIDGGK